MEEDSETPAVPKVATEVATSMIQTGSSRGKYYENPGYELPVGISGRMGKEGSRIYSNLRLLSTNLCSTSFTTLF